MPNLLVKKKSNSFLEIKKPPKYKFGGFFVYTILLKALSSRKSLILNNLAAIQFMKMKKIVSLCLFLLVLNTSYAKKIKNQYVRITTTKGECVVMLYNQTPLHRDNFVKLTKEGYFNGTLFHRVINRFMIQGGDPDSRNAKPGVLLGDGGPKYTIPAEFVDSLFHKKGVLAAAREGDDINPQKASAGSQFYLVQGKVFTDDQLNQLEQRRLKHKIPAYQREVYKTLGGTPHLDQNYTVFGEVVKGISLIDEVAQVATDKNDRPTEDISMTISLLKRREVRKLLKELAKTAPQQ